VYVLAMPRRAAAGFTIPANAIGVPQK